MDSSKQEQGSGAQPKSTSEAAPDIKASTDPEVQAMRGPDTLAAAVQVIVGLASPAVKQHRHCGQLFVDQTVCPLSHPERCSLLIIIYEPVARKAWSACSLNARQYSTAC
jgi:hypothetical protein